MSEIELKAKCTTCKKVYVMTDEQIAEASHCGYATSPCCLALATVEHVKAQNRRAANMESR